jgi:hypothetical protein
MARLEAEVAMIDIRHKETGALLLQVNAETMAGIHLRTKCYVGPTYVVPTSAAHSCAALT